MESNFVYTAPEIEVLRIQIEKGFAISSDDYSSEIGDYWSEPNEESEDY